MLTIKDEMPADHQKQEYRNINWNKSAIKF